MTQAKTEQEIEEWLKKEQANYQRCKEAWLAGTLPHYKHVKGNFSFRLWSQIRKDDSGCWVWTGCLHKPMGYGQTAILGKKARTHRAVAMFEYGPIPKGMLVCHTCDNPPCVNPSHLFIGTNLDNNRDKAAKRRCRAPKGSEHGGSKLIEADVLAIRALNLAGKSYSQIAKVFGVSRESIHAIVKQIAWKHVPSNSELSALLAGKGEE